MKKLSKRTHHVLNSVESYCSGCGSTSCSCNCKADTGAYAAESSYGSAMRTNNNRAATAIQTSQGFK